MGLGLGAVLGAGGTVAARAGARADESTGFGGEVLPCHGEHQAGVVTPQTAHVRFLAYRLHPETDAAGLQRMFRILTGDVEGLTSGAAPIADPEPELAARPAGLSITVGVGPDLVNRVDAAKRPEWLAPLPVFVHDRLSGDYDDGDLLLALQSDDRLPIAHATRMLGRDLVSFADPLWQQDGFVQARGAETDGSTPRNLMGHLDGTVNPSPEEFEGLVWLESDAGWLQGGTAIVLRRIRMELDTWDMVDRPGREQTIGRRLADGAPLTAGTDGRTDEGEHTPADFEAKNAIGLPVIATDSHMRRAHSTDPGERVLRRAANYEDRGESGQLFVCYQRDPLRQYVPIQRRLDEADLLNEWVTHMGSAVFAILPGFKAGEMLGATLFA